MVATTAVVGAMPGREQARGGARPIGSGEVVIDIRWMAILLWAATGLVLGLGVMREVVVHLIGAGTALKDLRHFALDAEHSLPAWYESFLMAAAAGITAVLAALARHHDPRNRLAWMLLAVIFLLMAIDEIVAFHEVTMAPLRNAFDLTGVLYFAWVILAAPVLIALAIFFIPFMFRLPWRISLRFAIAGAMFVGGAFGLEFVGGHYVSTGGFESLPYKIAATTEECLEIVGMTLFVSSLLWHLAQTAPMLRVAMQYRR